MNKFVKKMVAKFKLSSAHYKDAEQAWIAAAVMAAAKVYIIQKNRFCSSPS